MLEVTEPWEKGTIGAPSVVATSGEIRLYYASGGGVGLARSADGVAFTKEPAPIFEAAASGWDAGALRGQEARGRTAGAVRRRGV